MIDENFDENARIFCFGILATAFRFKRFCMALKVCLQNQTAHFRLRVAISIPQVNEV